MGITNAGVQKFRLFGLKTIKESNEDSHGSFTLECRYYFHFNIF